MKKNKVLKIVLIVLGALVALLAAAVLGVLFYLHSMAAGIPETLPDACLLYTSPSPRDTR